MAWLRVLLLAFTLLLPLVSSAKGIRACVVDSYKIKVTSYVKDSLVKRLRKSGVFVSLSNNGCDVKVLLGTPAVVEALKRGEEKKRRKGWLVVWWFGGEGRTGDDVKNPIKENKICAGFKLV